jgi:hypothetical protein
MLHVPRSLAGCALKRSHSPAELERDGSDSTFFEIIRELPAGMSENVPCAPSYA